MRQISRRAMLMTSAVAPLLQTVTTAKLTAEEEQSVQLVKAAEGGMQPQAATDAAGVVHVIYLYGDPAASDIGYIRKGPGERSFSRPMRVNTQPGSAIALGTVRGARLTIGRQRRIHVAWNGSTNASPQGPNGSAPMLYTRMEEHGQRFEAQRSLVTKTGGLDGGGALAADNAGNVYVAWQGQGQENGTALKGEEHRRVWLAKSSDGGQTFAAERAVSPEGLGACGCCGMGAIADERGNLYLLFRNAREVVHRDLYLLSSRDGGKTFAATDLHPWTIGACPMSTVSLAARKGRVLMSWETAKQVYLAEVESGGLRVGTPKAAPGGGGNRKHPALAMTPDGKVLLAWTEGTGWKKGGSLTWQVYDSQLRAKGAKGGSTAIPAWDFGAAVATGNGFLLFS